jgi:hypothetical protein
MNAIIFWSVAEYADISSRLTFKHNKNQVRMEIWCSDNDKIDVKTYSYLTTRTAYKQYKIKIGEAILGGWKVLNALPKRETWETKRSK